jgi:hypothetical protein
MADLTAPPAKRKAKQASMQYFSNIQRMAEYRHFI